MKFIIRLQHRAEKLALPYCRLKIILIQKRLTRMAEITNKTLFYLLFVFIAITLFAASLNFIKLGKFDSNLITGFQSSNASARVNVSFVDFGNGSLVYAPNLTTINTTDPDINPSSFKDPGPLVFQNDGNVDVNVTIYSVTASGFIGGTNPTYEW